MNNGFIYSKRANKVREELLLIPLNPFHLLYIFDPLCGWCYASAPALDALARVWPSQLKLRPSGLFSEAGARDMTVEWANYAWTNDQRIGAMTGQVFSERYHHDVLLRPTRFDSAVMNRALTCASELAPALEPRLLHSLQVARYVEGLDTANVEVVGRITAQVATAAGFNVLEDQCVAQLRNDDVLGQLTLARVQHTQALMSELSIRGVPQLLLFAGGVAHQVPSASLYQGGGAIVSEVQRLLDSGLAKGAQPA